MKFLVNKSILFMGISLLLCGSFLSIGCTTKKTAKSATLNVTLKKINPVETFGTFSVNDTIGSLSMSSLKIPIRGLVLENSQSGSRAEIFKCAADTNDGCLIEMASSNQLTDLLAAPQVKTNIGNYDTILLYHCLQEGGYTSFLNATVTDGSLTYYTHANGIVDNDSTAAAAISVQSVGCLTKHTLHKEIVFVDKATVNLQLYLDTRNLVWMGLSKDSPGWFANNCTGDFDFDGVANGAFVCVSNVDITGTQEAEAPVIERYLLNNFALLGLYFNGDGVANGDGSIIGGYARRFYKAGFNPAALPATDIFSPIVDFKVFTLNDDSTVTLSSFSPEGGTSGYLNISNFTRSAVVSGGTLNGSFTNEAGTLGSYSSVRID
jgi:hypothetical protein